MDVHPSRAIKNGADTKSLRAIEVVIDSDAEAGNATRKTEIGNEPETDSDQLEAAFSELLERVSVTGWKEAFGEEIVWIRRLFLICLLLSSGFSFFYICKSVQEWFASGYEDEITDFVNQGSLPFSNVTICAQIYFNETFVKNVVTVPKELGERFTSETGLSVDDLYHQLTYYLSLISRPRDINQKFLKYFWKLTDLNPSLHDFLQFTIAALPPCREILQKCSFNGQEFDCCDRAVRTVDDDGICFTLMLNFDTDNAVPSNRTFHQSRPGPNGGLAVEASVALDDFPMVDSEADNGFKLLIYALATGSLLSPLTAPHAATTFVKIVPEKRFLAKDCAPHGRMVKLNNSGLYHDPDGYAISIDKVLAKLYTYTHCNTPLNIDLRTINSTCGPALNNMLEWALVGNLQDNYESANIKELSPVMRVVSEFADNYIKDWTSTMMNGKKRLKHCVRWTYSSSGSFFDLQRPDQAAYKKIMYSKIYFYYGELAYRRYNQVKEIGIYLAFCNFGNVVGLYWGMSVVSFFHLMYYVPRYFYFLYKYGARKPTATQVRNIRVTVTGPAVIVTEC